MPKRILSSCLRRIAISLGVFAAAATASAATVIWSGLSGAGTNWSTVANWVGSVAPGNTDDVKFFDLGGVALPLQPNNLVDTSFTIGTLQFGQTNLGHTISIASGQTLSVTGGNLVVGTPGDLGVAKNLTNAVSGAGGALVVNNPAAVIAIQQGSATAVTGTRGNLDLSGLDTFTANVKSIGLGSTAFPNPGGANQREAGSLILAKTNFITLNFSDTLANYQLAGKTNAIELSRNPGNNAAILSQLVLGQSNVFNVDSLGFGRDKASASSAGVMLFNPSFTNNNPVAVFRGVAGGSSRVTWWAMGDMNANASSAQQSLGTNDFSNGTVDALVDTMSLGRDCSPQHTATGFNVGVLTFTAGTIDVNTLIAGNQVLGPNTSLAGLTGIVNVNGPTAKLVVNNTLELAHTTFNFVPGTSGTNAAKTFGILNIRNGGTVLANRINVGTGSTNNNTITIAAGTLAVTNNIGSPAKGLTTFAATNATLHLNVTGITNIFCANLISGGVTNNLSLDSVSVFSSYPKQVVLIKYTTQAGVGVTNFGLVSVPASAPGAYLSNNIANSSLDLVLPFDPRPIITAQPAGYSGNPGDNVDFNVTVSGISATPLSYQWYRGTTALVDGATGNGSTNFGSTTASLGITNAQAADNGNYTVVIANAYGSITSAPPAVLTISAGSVAPSITGPNNLTVIQGNNATLTASVSGNPAPALQWRRNGVDISGETGSSYTLVNAQYPTDDGAVFSIVATNLAGSMTNSATLTVIVPPSISSQPIGLVVTNTQAATFSVTASGVPPPTYQWYFNNTLITGATSSTYNIASADPTNTGSYKVLVSNSAGSTNSAVITLVVNSTMSAVTLAPANGATAICYDTPLAVTFNATPVLRAAGKIKIFNISNSTTPVDTIDLGQGTLQARAIAGESFNTLPVIITGNTAAIYPHLGVLTSNATYYVTIDNGVFADAAGAYFSGITAAGAWQFTTKVAGPANATNLVVAADNSADFDTVQGALDSLPANNTTPTIINVRNGFYTELVEVKKANVILRGQSRNGTLIGYPNNNNNNAGTHIRMSFKVNANDVALDNLTITNTTPQGGTQAEALMLETGAARIIINNCTVASYQDTILANTATTKAYFNNSLVLGDVDFIWGGGNLFFTNCEVRYLARAGNAGAVGPNPSPGVTEVTSNGFSFVNCLFSAPAGATNDTIGRTRGIAGANMAMINCLMAPVLNGWDSSALPTSNYRNWFYNCSNLTATASVTLSNGIALAATDVNLTNASSPAIWLYGWSPQLAPNIISQPSGQTVSAGQTANFSVSATGIPEPTYQWLKNGTPISGATGSSLSVASAVRASAGNYTVVVSNGSGSVTSSVALLTYTGNVPPVANTLSVVRPAGYSLKFALLDLSTNWSDADGDISVLTSTVSSTNAATVSYDSNYIYYGNANAVDDQIHYTISDGQGGTAAGVINITISTNPIAGAPQSINVVGSNATLNFAGIPTYPYEVQRSTNMVDWVTVLTTNAPAGGLFNFTDTFIDLGGVPPATAFYRTAQP